ncbi:hypothetical protein MNBD_ALPHA06-1011 [hydrothermal vent metagenome]|uniref:Uncharacterized protein n=1 Tax=hydrothermal vent metagenome TaxID=652676 RepID=A0A3B0SFC3_9ZZZZ
MQSQWVRHTAYALVLSYGLSVFFWLGFGVFNLVGFIVVSALTAALGVASGWVLGKKLGITLLATFVFRILAYLLMTGFFQR